MNLNEFKQIFKEECKKNNIKIKEENIESFYQYMKLILDWNQKVNLTAIKDEKEFIVKHFVDSLTIDYLIKDSKRILDIGTGAGFPGIPLKINNDSINVTLIDSVNKKVMVLNDVIEKLKLESIEALHIRAEELAKKNDYRECFDVVTTRAVSSLSTIAEYMLPFVKIGGKAICMKGPNIEEELQTSRNAIKLLGGEIKAINKLFINGEIERNIIVINKKRNTNKKYPRSQGKPAKEPIK